MHRQVTFAINVHTRVHYIHCILHVEHGRTWPIVIKVHTCTLHVHIYSHYKKASNQLMLLHVNKQDTSKHAVCIHILHLPSMCIHVHFLFLC